MIKGVGIESWGARWESLLGDVPYRLVSPARAVGAWGNSGGSQCRQEGTGPGRTNALPFVDPFSPLLLTLPSSWIACSTLGTLGGWARSSSGIKAALCGAVQGAHWEGFPRRREWGRWDASAACRGVKLPAGPVVVHSFILPVAHPFLP
jgi:hypothetical protein